MALQTFWYPRIDFPGGRIDLDEVYRLAIQKARVGSTGISASGLQETAVDRAEVTVSLVLWPLTKSRTDEIHAWWDAWALYGRPSTLTLDRLNTCTAQYEFRYNSFFSRAILVTDPFAPTRPEATVSRPLYSLSLVFRQDAPGI
ncbi:MAG: hypothetical protein ACREJC_21560 [Tepidisphaeraceae bacterium]